MTLNAVQKAQYYEDQAEKILAIEEVSNQQAAALRVAEEMRSLLGGSVIEHFEKLQQKMTEIKAAAAGTEAADLSLLTTDVGQVRMQSSGSWRDGRVNNGVIAFSTGLMNNEYGNITVSNPPAVSYVSPNLLSADSKMIAKVTADISMDFPEYVRDFSAKNVWVDVGGQISYKPTATSLRAEVSAHPDGSQAVVSAKLSQNVYESPNTQVAVYSNVARNLNTEKNALEVGVFATHQLNSSTTIYGGLGWRGDNLFNRSRGNPANKPEWSPSLMVGMTFDIAGVKSPLPKSSASSAIARETEPSASIGKYRIPPQVIEFSAGLANSSAQNDKHPMLIASQTYFKLSDQPALQQVFVTRMAQKISENMTTNKHQQTLIASELVGYLVHEFTAIHAADNATTQSINGQSR